jgi:hypothetical protein
VPSASTCQVRIKPLQCRRNPECCCCRPTTYDLGTSGPLGGQSQAALLPLRDGNSGIVRHPETAAPPLTRCRFPTLSLSRLLSLQRHSDFQDSKIAVPVHIISPGPVAGSPPFSNHGLPLCLCNHRNHVFPAVPFSIITNYYLVHATRRPLTAVPIPCLCGLIPRTAASKGSQTDNYLHHVAGSPLIDLLRMHAAPLPP